MKAVLLKQHGSLENVSLGEVEMPEVSAGGVLVRTRAAALNHLDLFVIRGMPGILLKMPHIPGADGAGIVEETGPGVTRFVKGDRVMLNPCVWCGKCEFCLEGEQSLCIRFGLVGESRAGTFAEYFAVPELNLERVPDSVTFEEAAAFSLVFQTAWRMLTTRAGLRAGEDVFIHGIGGGVSSAALQIVKLAGARAFVSSGDDDKLERARQMGADYAYNYKTTDVVQAVYRDTGKRGVDVVVDNVGKATWLQSLKIARKGGRIVTCGATTGPDPETEIRLIFWKQLQILGSTMSNCREYQVVCGLLGRGVLHPVIGRVFQLSESQAALEYLMRESQFGKVVLSLGE